MTMAKNIIELVVGNLGDKRKWRQYRARVKALPPGYREAAKALERYVMYLGASDDGPTLIRMFEDLADLMERSAADGLPIRDVVGDDPVDFAETFIANYSGGSWIRKEQARFVRAMRTAADRQDAGRDEGTDR